MHSYVIMVFLSLVLLLDPQVSIFIGTLVIFIFYYEEYFSSIVRLRGGLWLILVWLTIDRSKL